MLELFQLLKEVMPPHPPHVKIKTCNRLLQDFINHTSSRQKTTHDMFCCCFFPCAILIVVQWEKEITCDPVKECDKFCVTRRKTHPSIHCTVQLLKGLGTSFEGLQSQWEMLKSMDAYTHPPVHTCINISYLPVQPTTSQEPSFQWINKRFSERRHLLTTFLVVCFFVLALLFFHNCIVLYDTIIEKREVSWSQQHPNQTGPSR